MVEGDLVNSQITCEKASSFQTSDISSYADKNIHLNEHLNDIRGYTFADVIPNNAMMETTNTNTEFDEGNSDNMFVDPPIRVSAYNNKENGNQHYTLPNLGTTSKKWELDGNSLVGSVTKEKTNSKFY